MDTYTELHDAEVTLKELRQKRRELDLEINDLEEKIEELTRALQAEKRTHERNYTQPY